MELLEREIVSDKSCRENQNASLLFKNYFSENRAIYGIMWENMVEPDRPQMTMECGAENM